MRSDHGATLTILVVEDDRAIAELVRTLLNDVPGWGATVVHDAAAARAVFQHVRVEVLVLDMNLPGITGLELLQLLRQDADWQDPPVILVTARPEQPGVEEAIQSGTAFQLVPKPFDVDDLIEKVREAATHYGKAA